MLVLPDTLEAARVAREWLASDVDVPADLAGDVLLLTSELISNALRYGQPEVEIAVRVTPRQVDVAVTDRADAPPVMSVGPPASSQQSGRGLLLVASLATGWGYRPCRPGPGKTVWFTLRSAGS